MRATLRTLLLASVAGLALSAGAAIRRAPAQGIPVIDVAKIAQSVQHQFQTLAEWVKQISWMKTQYDMLTNTYNAIAHATDLSGVASALGGVARTYLPFGQEIGTAMSMVSMGGNMVNGAASGNFGSLFGQASSFMSMSRIYQSPENDEWQREMARREAVSANAQAFAQAGIDDAQDRIVRLEALQARLEAAQDGTEIGAVAGLIAVEQLNLTAHRTQLDQVRLLLAADDRVTGQRYEQMWRRDNDALIAETAPALAGW